MIIAVAICASVLMFCLVLILYNKFEGQQAKVEERIQGLAYDKQVSRRTDNTADEDGKKKKFKLALPKFKKKANDSQQKKYSAKNQKRLEKIEDEMFNVGIKVPLQTFIPLWLATAVIVPILLLVFGVNLLICLAIFVVILYAPMWYLKHKKKKRKAALEEQLIDAIGVLNNALKAGHSFQTAMHTIAEDMDAPISEEFGRVYKETQRGMTLEDSLNRMSERIGSDELSIMCTAIIIQRQVGGRLSDVLDNISGTIQERISLRGDIKVKTASGKVSGYIVGGLPILILLAISFLNPEYADILYHTTAGNIMLAISAVMEIVGFVVINKIVAIEY